MFLLSVMVAAGLRQNIEDWGVPCPSASLLLDTTGTPWEEEISIRNFPYLSKYEIYEDILEGSSYFPSSLWAKRVLPQTGTSSWSHLMYNSGGQVMIRQSQIFTALKKSAVEMIFLLLWNHYLEKPLFKLDRRSRMGWKEFFFPLFFHL